MSSSSAIPERTADEWFAHINECIGYFGVRLSQLKDANKQDGIRGRDLALAITNIEQGLFWLESAAESIAKHQSE